MQPVNSGRLNNIQICNYIISLISLSHFCSLSSLWRFWFGSYYYISRFGSPFLLPYLSDQDLSKFHLKRGLAQIKKSFYEFYAIQVPLPLGDPLSPPPDPSLPQCAETASQNANSSESPHLNISELQGLMYGSWQVTSKKLKHPMDSHRGFLLETWGKL